MDELFMQEALKLAQEAFDDGEVPVGCVIVKGDRIVGRGRNRREKGKTALAHAEVEAISEACANLGGWRLWECTLYVTLEPCPMCAGAIINARIPRVVYGASDDKCGATGSVCNLFSMKFNHHPKVECGILEEECGKLLQDFFAKLRIELRTRPKWKPKNQAEGTSLQ
jgi:tRNA(adenine34) deaminase